MWIIIISENYRLEILKYYDITKIPQELFQIFTYIPTILIDRLLMRYSSGYKKQLLLQLLNNQRNRDYRVEYKGNSSPKTLREMLYAEEKASELPFDVSNIIGDYLADDVDEEYKIKKLRRNLEEKELKLKINKDE